MVIKVRILIETKLTQWTLILRLLYELIYLGVSVKVINVKTVLSAEQRAFLNAIQTTPLKAIKTTPLNIFTYSIYVNIKTESN